MVVKTEVNHNFEHKLKQAKASLRLEGLELSPQNEKLVRDHLQGKISEKAFYQQLLKNINNE